MSTAIARQTIVDLAAERDWQRRTGDEGRSDSYSRGTVRIRVIWGGEDKLSGASLFHDEMYESYTRDLNTLRAWFKR
ncbi:MAG: hypothetical protein ACR2JM_12365 [Mycobacterium sp.]